jgi:hypothetical protein
LKHGAKFERLEKEKAVQDAQIAECEELLRNLGDVAFQVSNEALEEIAEAATYRPRKPAPLFKPRR